MPKRGRMGPSWPPTHTSNLECFSHGLVHTDLSGPWKASTHTFPVFSGQIWPCGWSLWCFLPSCLLLAPTLHKDGSTRDDLSWASSWIYEYLHPDDLIMIFRLFSKYDIIMHASYCVFCSSPTQVLLVVLKHLRIRSKYKLEYIVILKFCASFQSISHE